MRVTTDYPISYLQRAALDPYPEMPATAGPGLRKLERIRGTGVIKRPAAGWDDRSEPLPTADLLNGLFGCRVGLAFMLNGNEGNVAVCVGTWANGPARGTRDDGEERQQLVRAAFESLYPRVDFDPMNVLPAARSSNAGFALGIPDVTPDRPVKGGLPVDRLIRAMGNDPWASLVLAEPVAERRTSEFRDEVMAEMRRVQSVAQAERADSPLARHYVELLTALLKNLTLGLGTGVWRTGVYLLGEGVSYYKLASLWQGLFSGENSLPEAVRVWPSPMAAELAQRWALPTVPGPAAPKDCQFAHPLLYQTFLTSAQLAAYVHLPERETSGFAVNTLHLFDVEPPAPKGGRAVSLGPVKQHRRILTRQYTVDRDSLTRHALVAGYTGGGKTTTIFHLLKQVDLAQTGTNGVPFLVLEPAKTEYQELQHDPQFWEQATLTDEALESLRADATWKSLPGEVAKAVWAGVGPLRGKLFPTGTAFVRALTEVLKPLGKVLPAKAPDNGRPLMPDDVKNLVLKQVRVANQRIQVIRLGNETRHRFRLNPFEVLDSPRVSVSTHLDLLRAVFNASFGMWSPLPEVLEQCLDEVYRDYGWDLTWNTNPRLSPGSKRSRAFPTLTDLWRKVDEVVPRLGYDKKLADDIRGALRTRLNSLRVGGKGRMLDTQETDATVEQLFRRPTVLEFEGVGSDDDKAFLMGLLLIRLIEHCWHLGRSETLRHLLVIEEAHRLLGRPDPTSSEAVGNPRAKAVETFSHLFSEIRAYGQGIVVSDQSPARLIPDTIKNTGLKVGHQIIGPEDRMLVGGAMAMEESQQTAFATLAVGEALVFATGADAPVLVAVTNGKADVVKGRPGDPVTPAGLPPAGEADALRDAVRGLVEDPNFQKEFVRLVLSVTEDAGALGRLWDGFITREQAVRKRGMSQAEFRKQLLAGAAAWFAQRRGRQGRWAYKETDEVEELLGRMLQGKIDLDNTIIQLSLLVLPFKERPRSEAATAELRQRMMLAVVARREARAKLASLVLAFQARMKDLHRREFEPFLRCKDVCDQTPEPLCLYRHAVADLLRDAARQNFEEWQSTYDHEARRGNGTVALKGLARGYALELVEDREGDPDGVVRRIGLCYAQHMLSHYFPENHSRVLDDLLKPGTPPATNGV